MPLLPVDLQTLFGQTPQVGKEQGARQEGVPQAQAQQAGQVVQRTLRDDTSVPQTRDPDEGPEEARIRAQRERERRREGRRRAREAPAKPAPARPSSPPAKEPLRDPALGRNVDVSG